MKNLKTFDGFLNEGRGKAEKASFSIDVESYEGWTFGEEWNGWQCPYFEKAEANRIAKDAEGKYDAKNDAYVFHYDEDETTKFKGLTIETEEGQKKVWAIGAFEWTWSKDDTNESIEISKKKNRK